MKRIQKSREKMMKLSHKTLYEAPQAAKDDMPGVEVQITALGEKVVLIEENAALQSEDLTGIAVEKNNKKEFMIDCTMYVGKKGASFAFNSNLPVLLHKVNKPRSYFEKLSDTACAARCKEVYNVLLPYLDDLLPYGVTAFRMTDVVESVDAFSAYISEPKENIDERKTITATIETLLDDCELILEGTDLAVDSLDETHEAFVKKYKNSREINNPGGRVLSVRGNVKRTDGEAVEGVRIEFVGSGIVKRSTGKGNFQVAHLAPGVYLVKCSKYGYKDVVISIAVNANERTEVEVVMEWVLATV